MLENKKIQNIHTLEVYLRKTLPIEEICETKEGICFIFKANSFISKLFYIPFQTNKCISISEFYEENSLIVWENQWTFQSHLVKSKIQSKLGNIPRIHGRKTQVRRVDKPTAASFLKTNHLLPPITGKIRLGLYDTQNTLIALSVFSSGIRWKEREGRSYEILRFCNHHQYRVQGGFSKILKAFILDKKPIQLMTYSEKGSYQTNLYEKSGFDKSEDPKELIYYLEKNQTYPQKYGSENAMKIIALGNYKFQWHG
ncbi:MAG: hypothetical protein N4A45_08025 [Flavobacteriales bacterium]|jgi:hypothetical protein|nr:hypothetical protein [Flavobacteriales bacterium]